MFLAPDRLANLERYDIAQYLQGGYSGLGKDRSIAASFALRNGFDKVLFIDSDQSWVWEDVKKVLDSKLLIAAGMVPLKSYPTQLNFTPLAVDKEFYDPEDGVVTPAGVARWCDGVIFNEEMPVAAVGTGFMCIDRSVLQTLVDNGSAEKFLFKEAKGDKTEWVACWNFFPSGVLESNYYGEDFSFCILAGRAGIPIGVNTTVKIPHHGWHEYKI